MILLFVLGLILGSFLNVVIYRLPKGKSLASPPSSCPACGTRLGPIDLVPLLSYAFLGGRCRHCGAKISLRYPLVELLTGLVFSLLYLRYGYTAELVKYACLSSILICAAFIDMDARIIPDKLNLFALATGLVFLAVSREIGPLDGLYGLLAGGGFLLLLAIVSRGGMGGGDIKLFAVIGLYLGFPKVGVAMFISFLIAGILGIILIASGIKSRKEYIPLGPFISIGAFFVIMWYNELMMYYINLMY